MATKMVATWSAALFYPKEDILDVQTEKEDHHSILLFSQNYNDWLVGAVPVMSAMHDDQQFRYGGMLFLKCT